MLNDKKVTTIENDRFSVSPRFQHYESNWDEVQKEDGSLPEKYLDIIFDGRKYSDADILKLLRDIDPEGIIQIIRIEPEAGYNSYRRTVTLCTVGEFELDHESVVELLGRFIQKFITR